MLASPAPGVGKSPIGRLGNKAGLGKLWDTCAPEAILREAGGTMTDLHGAPLVYDDAARLQLDRGIVASNGACHEALIAGLAEAH